MKINLEKWEINKRRNIPLEESLSYTTNSKYNKKLVAAPQHWTWYSSFLLFGISAFDCKSPFHIFLSTEADKKTNGAIPTTLLKIKEAFQAVDPVSATDRLDVYTEQSPHLCYFDIFPDKRCKTPRDFIKYLLSYIYITL